MYHVQKWVNSLTWETESNSYAPSAPDSSATDGSHLVTNNNNTNNSHKENSGNNDIHYYMNTFHHNSRHNQTNDGFPHDSNNYQTLSRRLFTNEENRTLVKIFRDHFTAKMCPNLPEVRDRIQGTKLGTDRGPVSVRNKFKRLQNESQWMNYI